MSDFGVLREKLRNHAAKVIENGVNAGLPEGVRMRLALDGEEPAHNPDEDDEDDEDDEEDQDGDEEDQDGDEEGRDNDDGSLGSLMFEDGTLEDNLSAAVSAYRVTGSPGDCVASHKAGRGFFGAEEDLEAYSNAHHLSADDWELWDDPAEIMKLPYDDDALKDVIKMMDQKASTFASAEDFYGKFHWGDVPSVTSVKIIPGITGTLVHLGVARQIEYGAHKDGKWEEYFHEFGEHTKEYPSVYAIMDENERRPICLVIHGGKMRIEGRGIVE